MNTNNSSTVVDLVMEPEDGSIDLSQTALLIIDMQASVDVLSTLIEISCTSQLPNILFLLPERLFTRGWFWGCLGQ